MIERVVQHEDRHAVLLPRKIVESLGLTDGSLLQFELSNGHVTVTVADGRAEISDEDRRFVEQFYRDHEAVFKALAK